MTERSNTAIETAEAIIRLLEICLADAKDDGRWTYQLALRDVQIFAASLRLHQPPKRGRRPNASKGGE
jgi:hypothetical protein